MTWVLSFPKVRNALVILGVFHVVGLVLTFVFFADALGNPVAQAAVVVEVGLAVFYFVLAGVAHRAPFATIVAGAGVWVLLVLAQAALNPASLMTGWVGKAICIAALFYGIHAARRLRGTPRWVHDD